MTDPADLAALAAVLQGTLLGEAQAALQAELTARGAAAALEELAFTKPQAADWLAWAAANHSQAGVRGQSLAALVRLAGAGVTQAVDSLYRLAVEDDLLAARQAIATQGWQATRHTLRALFDWFERLAAGEHYPESGLPELTRAYFEEASPALRRRLVETAPALRSAGWAGIVSALEVAAPQALAELVNRFPAYTVAERAIALEGLDRLAASGSQPAREALVQVFLRHDDPQARDIAIRRAYLPEDPAARALFFFLAESWERLAALDFDHRLLVAAYEEAGRSLRRRMLEHARRTGQADWLRAAESATGPGGESRLLHDLTDADWDLTLRRLEETDRPEELWRLAQVAPPVWSAAILARLNERGWYPADAEEREGYQSLAAQARVCLDDPLVIHPRKALHAPTGLTTLALRPDGRVIAGGSTGQEIYLWNLPDGDLHRSLASPAPVTRVLAYTPDGEFLAAASGDNRIRAFRPSGGQMLKTLEGPTAPVRALVFAPDGRALYSAGFDGRLRAFRFPTGPQVSALSPGQGEIFGLALASNGRHLASGGADGILHIFTLPDLVEFRAPLAAVEGVTQLAGTPAGDFVVTAGREPGGAAGALRVWNVTSGGLVRAISYGGPAITSLVLLPSEQVLAGGRLDGEITLWNLSTGQVIDRLLGHKKAVNALAFSTVDDRLYSSAGESEVQMWDLRAFLSVRLAADPRQAGAAAETRERARQASARPSERKWLAFAAQLAQWRQRYDIEIGEFAPIHTGSFDIEL